MDKRAMLKSWRSATLCYFFAALTVAGCSSGPKNAAVNAEKARQTLRAALDSWKRGDKVNALQSASPAIYVIDPDWEAGAVLENFEVLGDGKEMDANLFCQVRLTLRSSDGKMDTQEATFIVSTAPNLTVSRKLF